MSCCRSVNLCMYQGDDLRLLFTVVDSGGLEVDITDSQSIKWQISERPNSVAIISKELGSSITINSVNQFYFDLAADETDNLAGVYYHEAEITTDTGKKYTGLSGSFTIKQTQIK